MDDLAALDAIVTPGSIDVKIEGGAGEGDRAGLASTSARSSSPSRVASAAATGGLGLGAKRRRVRSPGSVKAESLASPLREVKAENGEEGTPVAAAASSEERFCLGCQRSSKYGVEWLDPSKGITWAFKQNSGNWCRECYSAWRTCFSHSHSLALFAKWLEPEENKTVWDLHLMAYLTHISEGSLKITMEMVQKRIGMLKFLSGAVGFSLEPSCIVSLGHLVNKCPGHSVEPSALVLAIGPQGPHIGVRVPITVLRPEMTNTSVQRPPTAAPMLWSRTALATSLDEDRNLMQQIFNLDLPPRPADIVKVEDEESGPQTTRLQSRMKAMIDVARRLVGHFGTGLWDQVKESQFTAPIQKLSGFLAEAGTQ